MDSNPVGLHYLDGTRDIVLEEVLRTEGIPYERLSVADALENCCSLVLGEVELSGPELDLVHGFVDEGGTLIALRPGDSLCELFGLELARDVQRDGYLAFETAWYSGRLQVLGTSRGYGGGSDICHLDPSGKGGIIETECGRGKLVIFAFDLAGTFLSIQQPDSKIGRAYDTSRVDPGLAGIPQLEVMRRIIASLILDGIPHPVPRKWYFPNCHLSAVILSGDQDGSDSGRMEVVHELVRNLKAPYTLFITPRNQPMSRDQLSALRRGGMEIALHANFTGGPPFSREEFRSQMAKAEEDAGVKMRGGRNHALRWGTVTMMPLWMEEAGLEYDSDLGLMLPEEGTQGAGYWVGGGLPYHFIHPETYRRINVLEHPLTAGDDVLFWDGRPLKVDIDDPGWLPSHLHTESDGGQSGDLPRKSPPRTKTYYPGFRLTEEGAFDLARRLMEESMDGYHTVQCYNCHPLYLSSRATGEAYHHSDAFFRMTVEYARERGVLLLNHGEWNDFWRRREAVGYTNLRWDPPDNTLHFDIENDGSGDVTHLLPMVWEDKSLVIQIDGNESPHCEFEFLGRKYTMFTVPAGSDLVRVDARYRRAHAHD